MRPEDVLHIHLVLILREYARPDVLWWHTPNGEKRDKRVAAKLWRMGVRPGVADFAFVVDGAVHFLEIKQGDGRMSGAQDVFMQDAERAGATYRCATGLAEAITALNEIGACRARLTVSDARNGGGMRKGEGAAMPSSKTNTEMDRAALN